jgi:hypothetical protein
MWERKRGWAGEYSEQPTYAPVSDESASITADDHQEERMTLVDWRWAAEKGFWNRQQQCWIEETGGRAAFLLQRALKRQKKHGSRRSNAVTAKVRIILC